MFRVDNDCSYVLCSDNNPGPSPSRKIESFNGHFLANVQGVKFGES